MDQNVFYTRFGSGVNFGGWLSQCEGRAADPAHWDTFITRKDVEAVARWGFTHVRLPVDAMYFEKDGVLLEEGLCRIDRALDWCFAAGLRVVLDLHQAPGYSFNTLKENCLFDNAVLQDRFVSLWEGLARRYRGIGEELAFELLNEIVEPKPDRWNALALRTVSAIRGIDPNRVIIVGGINYNAVSRLADICDFGDPLVVYNFHFYEPMLFTHQLAGWNQLTLHYGKHTAYPSVFPGVAEFIKQHPEYEYASWCADRVMDQDVLSQQLVPAREFAAKTGNALYCGEYGVIEHADADSRRNWHRDLCRLLDELKVARACWSYKGMDFGLFDDNAEPLDETLVRITAGK